MSDRRTVIRAINKMKNGQYTLEELGITDKDLLLIGNEGYRIRNQFDFNKNDRIFYIVPRDDMAYTIVSEMTEGEQKLRLLQMSDLHIGSKEFDEEGLRKTLAEAVKRKVQYVHIAGDTFDGNNMYREHARDLRYASAEGQINLALSIFADYDLNYIVSLGNHDDSFSRNGAFDALKVLELKMQMLGKKFIYLQAYEANIVHCGVVFRLIHLSGANSRSKSYKIQTFIANTLESNGNDVILGNKKYNIRSVHAGHFHIYYSFSMAGIDCCSTGNFKYDTGYTKRMGITGKTGALYKDYVFKKGQIISLEQEYIVLR